jgi:type II secretory pathway pseudopilin PulG
MINTMRQERGEAGFTLLELLVVAVIVILLVLVMIFITVET